MLIFLLTVQKNPRSSTAIQMKRQPSQTSRLLFLSAFAITELASFSAKLLPNIDDFSISTTNPFEWISFKAWIAMSLVEGKQIRRLKRKQIEWDVLLTFREMKLNRQWFIHFVNAELTRWEVEFVYVENKLWSFSLRQSAPQLLKIKPYSFKQFWFWHFSIKFQFVRVFLELPKVVKTFTSDFFFATNQ